MLVVAALVASVAAGCCLDCRWPQARRGSGPVKQDMDQDLRRIMTTQGVIDTRTAHGIVCDGVHTAQGADHLPSGHDGQSRREAVRQWFVQTAGLLSASERAELETDAGLSLGPYFPHSAHLIVTSHEHACRAARSRHVLWVGERESKYKLDSSILSMGDTWPAHKAIEPRQNLAMALYVALWPKRRRDTSADLLAAQVTDGIMAAFGTNVSVRAPAADKLVVDTTILYARRIAEWLAHDAYVMSVERKTMFVTRNEASNRILLSGPSAVSKSLDSTPLERAGLNGSGVVIGVADTGLDFDHCMLWQQPFDWFCFDPYPSSLMGVEFTKSKLCPLSAYAGLLENYDFEQFLATMMNATSDVLLMESGRTKGASRKPVPLNLEYPGDRQRREAEGYRFSLANDTSLPVLLNAWRKVRRPLLSILSREGLCEDCGGELRPEQGVVVFEPKMPFMFSKDDTTWDTVYKELGENWTAFEKILTEKCFCFWTIPSTASVNEIESWQGPVPPVRQLMAMTTTPTASIIRKGIGLTALPPEMLEGLCNATRGGGDFLVPGPARDEFGVRQDICQNVTFDFAEPNTTLNPCDLQWDPRAVESSLARCISAVYLQDPQYLRTRIAANDPFLWDFSKRPPALYTFTEDALEDTSDINFGQITPDHFAKDEFQQKAQIYTFSTTLAWWKEYTTLPPFNYVDFSRRMVNAYYTYDGCEACGMCARLRLDSRKYPNAEASSQLPSSLTADGIVTLYLNVSETDWRLDAYEARNVAFSAEMQLTVITDLGRVTIDETVDAKVGFCVLTENQYQGAANIRNRSFWAESCLNPGGKFFGDGSHVQDMNISSFEPFRALRELDSGATQYGRSESIMTLQPSAGGWRVVAWNDGLSSSVVDVAVQLYTLPLHCSDMKDGSTGINENTRSLDLSNRNVRSLLPNDQCEKDGRTYCDNTQDSGRQLDLCLVCGGACFAPDCTKDHCYVSNSPDENRVRLRFLGEFPMNKTSKVFRLPGLSAPNGTCPSPTDDAIQCAGNLCTYLNECRERIETYDVDTTMLRVKAGVPHIFEKGRLEFESNGQNRLIRMKIQALMDPTFHQRTGRISEGILGGGEVKLGAHWPRIVLPSGDDGIVYKGRNLTTADYAFDYDNNLDPEDDDYYYLYYYLYYDLDFDNYDIVETPEEIVVTMNETFIPDFLEGLSYTASSNSGTTMENRQRMMRIQIQFLQSNGNPWPVSQVAFGYEGGFSMETQSCKIGFSGVACDTIYPPFELRMTVDPADSSYRVVSPENTEGKSGRKRLLSRGGHGTHVVTSIVGRAMALDEDFSEAARHDGLAGGAFLSFTDIASTGNSYLTPPESLGAGLLERPYTEASARIFLNPWTCEDYVWWKGQDQASQPEQAVASDSSINQGPNVCNRYGNDAWEIDEFVARHPDLLVVFPAGDNGAGGTHTISSPGTCKNCITVGTSQSWSESLEASRAYHLSQCRPEDCPQDFDKTETCANPEYASPYSIPACCPKYGHASYGPGSVDPRSSRGYAVIEQAPFDVFGGNTYKDVAALKFARVKPDLVAPGVNIISGRSDGDTDSSGTNHQRCSITNAGSDSSCLTTMSGSSMAAAKITALAALVRQVSKFPLPPPSLSIRLYAGCVLARKGWQLAVVA